MLRLMLWGGGGLRHRQGPQQPIRNEAAAPATAETKTRMEREEHTSKQAEYKTPNYTIYMTTQHDKGDLYSC